MQNQTNESIQAVNVVAQGGAGGGITTSGISDFINSQVIPVLLIVAAVMVIYFFITGKQKLAMGVIAGSLVGIGFIGITANWQSLSTWVAGLLGQ